MALAVGDIVGERYVVEEHISAGSFGSVYRAADREIRSHQVALKLLHRSAASDAERAEALRELMLIASVSHPAVVQFKDYGWYQSRLWFAMPWYRGRPLDQVLGFSDNVVALGRVEAKPIFVRVAHGLAAMHAVGIHHHDIKPENIFLAEMAGFPAGFPVLLDLGIATKRGENPKGFTPDYASPETAAAMLGTRVEAIGGATDVYSLALVLRNAIDPSLIEARSDASVIARLNERATRAVPLPKIRELRYLAPHFERWLNLDPGKRPSAEQLAKELEILSLPEEKREAQLRLLKRVGPVLAVGLIVVLFLMLQVQRQKLEISVKEQVITLKDRVIQEELSQNEQQLVKIESQAKSLGNEHEQLRQAVALGRSLNAQLQKAGDRNQTLLRKNGGLTAERDALSLEKQALTSERDGLQQDKQTLAGERDDLNREQQKLIAERDRLTFERNALTGERDALLSDKRALSTERDGLASDKQTLTRERDGLLAEKQGLSAERDALARDKQNLKAANDALQGEIDALKARPQPDTPAAASGGAPAQ